jgi:streptogramin lyase
MLRRLRHVATAYGAQEKGRHMQNRYQRLLLVAAIVALASVVGVADRAFAQAITITEFSIPTPNSDPEVITTGPDGALWFTEANASKIGRITTAGAFVEHPTLSTNSFPTGITTGPDGALWFTEAQANKIGRITTAA